MAVAKSPLQFKDLIKKLSTNENITEEEAAAMDEQNKEDKTFQKFTFLQGEELTKFRGNRTKGDGIFTEGPKIQDFFNNIEAYISRHGISTDRDKIVSVKLNIDQTAGDARFVVQSIFDPN